MNLHFKKYQATGNDFVLVDNRNGSIHLSIDQIKQICDRKFGVGADGLILIEKHPSLDFNLVYYNSDGSQSLCGNGSRAAVKMASSLGMINGKAKFNAYDGPHEAEIGDTIKVKMNNVTVKKDSDFIDTGSPHVIKFVTGLKEYPVYEEGKKLRDSKPGGTNVNFVELLGDKVFVRTYERGVENETLSCGTGVTAVALAAHFKGFRSPVSIMTLGGDLSVQFTASAEDSNSNVTFHDIFLIGPAKMVFEGDLEL
ncbi:MAG: diaminopimelate epimerase [Bacteroidota bacterium]